MSLFEDIVNYLSRHKYGIAGTIVIHLLLLELFMLWNLPDYSKNEFVVLSLDFEEVQQMDESQIPREFLVPVEERSNTARNESAPQEIDRGSYNRYDELNESRKSEIDEEIEEKLRELEDQVIQEQRDSGFGYTRAEANVLLKSKRDRDLDNVRDKKPKAPSVFEGASNISYRLHNRYDVWLKVPVYLCQFEGIVTVNIAVARSGEVVSSKIDRESTNTQDPCLLEAALSAANQTKFNNSYDADRLQKGSITYIFIPQ
jgi:hypothetical protein